MIFKRISKLFCILIASCTFISIASADVIDFDDLVGQASFTQAGIASNYLGYEWGSGSLANIPQGGNQGWGYSSGSVGGRTANSGSSFAWTFSGAQSHFIDFQGPVDFQSGMFASTSFGGSNDASTVQLFGYDENNTLIATSGVLNLSTSYQQLNSPTLLGITTLEIRTDSYSKWMVMDDLTFDGATVPEPGNLLILSIGLLGLVVGRKQKVKGLLPQV